MGTFCNKDVKMNAVDCLGCKNIPNCLKENPSAKKLTVDERNELLSSIDTVNFSAALTKGKCGGFPLFIFIFHHKNRCLRNLAIKIPRCVVCFKEQRQAMQQTF